MACKGCIFDEVDSVNEPCRMCKRNPEDNRQDCYYHGGIVDFVENKLGIKLLTHQKVLLVKAAKRDKEENHGCSTCKFSATIIRDTVCYNCVDYSNWERKE